MALYMAKKTICTLCFIPLILLNFSIAQGQTSPKSFITQQYLARADKFADDLMSDSAIVYYQKTANIYKKQQAWKKYYLVQVSIAKQYLQLEQYIMAIRLLTQYLPDIEKSLLPEVAGMYYQTLGEIDYQQEKFTDALAFATKATKYYNSLPETDLRKLDNLRLIAAYKARMAYFEESFEMTKACLKQLDELPTSKKALNIKVKALLLLGRLYISRVVFDKVLDICYQTILLLDTMPSSKKNLLLRQIVFNRKGLVYKNLRKFPLAKQNYRKSIKIAQQVYGNHHKNLAIEYQYLGNVYLAEGGLSRRKNHLDSALFYHKKSLETVQGSESQDTFLGDGYFAIANIYHLKTNFREATRYFQKSYEELTKHYEDTNPNLVTLYLKWAQASNEEKRPEQQLSSQ
ncbi:hypothetical protein BKI52_36110 [marine bacterium AO1-C]|nr:hypothetical protein BKI52_36110 [marine bacterium AO1-C]